MKTILYLLLAVLFLGACEGPTGPMGPEGPMGPNGSPGQNGYGTYWYTTSITIKQTEWELVGKPGELNSYFFVEKPVKELSETIFREGAVIGYIESDKGIKNGLPYVLHLGQEDNPPKLWTQTYDFDFYPGAVGFYVTYSDFETELTPGDETFHIVLIW